MRQALKRRRHVPTKHIPGSVNPVTGKRYAEDGYAPSTINHNLSVTWNLAAVKIISLR